MQVPSPDFEHDWQRDEHDWQRDWRTFWLHVENELLAGESLPSLGKRIAGMTVEWSGVLEELDLDPEYPSATMLMPDLQIRLSLKEKANVWGLVVPIENRTQSEWKFYRPGTLIKILASIVPSWNPFGSFDDCPNEDGSRLISVRVTSGRPLSCD